MERHIVHFDLDAFFIGVELLKDSRLKGLPLAVGGKGDRGVVAACSYEARKFGVHSAMPMKLARRLCPELLVLSSDWEGYSKYSRMVTEIIASKVPLYEKSSVDEFYVDLTGMDKYFGCSKYSQELKQYITKETGLSITYGLASNKLISKVATNEVKPDGQILIPFGDERGYLSPMPVEKLPMVGAETSKLLKSMGVHKVKTLAEIPIEYLVNMFGKNGHGLWQKANGIDDSPVVPYHEQKSIGTEETFGNDTIDIGFMESKLVAMTEKVGFELRQSHHLTGCITVTVRYANFDTISKQKQITYTNADHILLPRVKELFHSLYDRRLRVRLIGVRFSHLVPGNYQISLFDDTAEAINLYSAIDSIKSQFGAGVLTRATTLLYPKTR